MNVYILVFSIGFLCFFLLKFKKLTRSGAAAAFAIGVITATGIGASGLLLFAVFFGSSIIWGQLHFASADHDVVDKNGPRDAFQVVANGGFAALCSLAVLLFPAYSLLWLAGFVSSLAAANADTWASELGKFSKEKPIHLLTGKRVRTGVSGAVSGLGTAAAFAGSFVMAVAAVLIWWSLTGSSHIWLLLFTIIGFVANLVDTVAGAAFQTLYRCPECGATTEKRYHCTVTERIKGLPFVTNDVVNLTCTGSGAILGIFAVLILL